MHPAERVRIVVETARAVLDGRLDADNAAAALDLQSAQILDLLRGDRISVTRSEAEEVALTLRRLGEQVADSGAAHGDTEAYSVVAAILGDLAQALR